MRVILADHVGERAGKLEASLGKHGHTVVDRLQTAAEFEAHLAECDADVVMLSMLLPGPDAIPAVRRLLQQNPCPVVVYDGDKDADAIARVIDAGISVYVTDDILTRDLTALLNLAVARFRKFRSLQRELESTRDKLAERKSVDRAKALLIKHHCLDEVAAHHALQQLAMNQRISLRDAARNVIAMLETLPK
ncbi:MAG: ANTAR domain-containing protein [Woeseiaceae bacterium]|nr:ANTAR domain-containing protein [Woeseiaceae bacterium]